MYVAAVHPIGRGDEFYLTIGQVNEFSEAARRLNDYLRAQGWVAEEIKEGMVTLIRQQPNAEATHFVVLQKAEPI